MERADRTDTHLKWMIFMQPLFVKQSFLQEHLDTSIFSLLLLHLKGFSKRQIRNSVFSVASSAMAPKKVISPEAEAKKVARAKAKALATGYVSSTVPPPFTGTPSEYIAQMIATEDVLSSVAMSSTQTIEDILPTLIEEIVNRSNLLNACQMTLKTREKANKDMKKKQEPKTESTKMEKYEGKMTLFVNTPSGQRIKIVISKNKSLAKLKEKIGEKSKEFGKTSEKWKGIAILKDGKFLNKHPRGMTITHLNDNETIDVMWFDDVPDDAFPIDPEKDKDDIASVHQQDEGIEPFSDSEDEDDDEEETQ